MFLEAAKRIRVSEFLKNTITSFTGSTVSQVIPILTAPVLARIYEPEDYGRLGLYMGFSVILGSLATLQYSNALLLPKEEKHFNALVKLSLKNSLLTSAVTALLLLILFKPLASLIRAESITYALLLLPLSMYMTGVSNTLFGFANKRKLFKLTASNRILSAVVTVVCSITLGIVFDHWLGLLVGYLASQFVNSCLLFLKLKKFFKTSTIAPATDEDISQVRKKYSSFPKYGLFTDLLNNFTYQIPIFLLNIFAGSFFVGIYNMCNRLLGLPSAFVSSAIGEVFKQRASEDFHRDGSCRPIYVKTLKTLSLLSIIPFVALIIWGPQLFGFFLGEKWTTAGHYARILAPIYLLRFVNSPLSFIIYFFAKLKIDLAATLYLNATSFIILFFALQHLSIETSLLLFTANFCLIYVFMILYSYKLSKRTI